MAELYNEYFKIDPKYFPQVTKKLIENGEVSWKNYFANEAFIKILNQTIDMINGTVTKSLFTWGPYGSGKSHLILTLTSMMKASDEEIVEYFTDQNLSKDLMNKFIAMKNSGKIITVHRIGSANIKTETDLILAVQQSLMKALEENGIENQGEASMKDSFINYLSKPANRNYFAELIKERPFDFGSQTVDDIEKIISSDNPIDFDQSESMMRKVMSLLKDIGQTGILKDADAMSAWIQDIIEKNNIKAILFAWDEFSEFFQSHPMGLTGFQTLAEISLSSPFYFVIVTHEAERVFADKNAASKLLDRFQKPIEITLPENTAFRLLANAMKLTDDPVLKEEWNKNIKPQLNHDLAEVRRYILSFERTANKKKSAFSDEDLQSIVPIHPYAAIILRSIASMFNSNQRSMFDFIINESDDTKGFKNFINHNGPFSRKNILTVDMLWDFFCDKQVKGLSDDVRGIFLSYDALKSDKLLPDEQSVLKTILILQAVSVRISNDALLAPSEQTLDLAFSGTDWQKNKAVSIAKGLVSKGLVFEKPMANGKSEYCVANGNVGDDINKYKEQARNETKTATLITLGNLPDAVSIPKSVAMRYKVEYASENGFQTAINNHYRHTYRERIKAIITFAMNDTEAQGVKNNILKNVNSSNNDIIYIEALTPMGNDLYNQYIDALAFCKYYDKKDTNQAAHYQNQAESVLMQWSQNIANGAFMVFTPDNVNGERKANLAELQDYLREYNYKLYPNCLEMYSLNETLYGQYNLSQGAELGIKHITKGAYSNSNKKKSIENALDVDWNSDDWWNDTSKQSLTIVKVKKRILEIIEDSFKNNNGEVSVLSIFDEMEKPPFGFMPNSITAYVLGFCLSEFAKSDYFWSNHSNTESMTPDKMKTMIANTLNHRTTSVKNYKEEYIVTMTTQMKEFLNGSSEIFGIPQSQCTSIEGTRDQIRIKMKNFQFPIWCIKTLLDDAELSSTKEEVTEIIDAYTGIANTANSSTNETESSLAEKIGKKFLENPVVLDDLKSLINDSNCREGMIKYIRLYKNGELSTLASEIKDNGEYIEQVRKKFNAADGNWVWNTQTADEKIDGVILEYKIIKESNKSLSSCTSIAEVISEWNRRTNNIKMPCEVAAKQVGDLGAFLWELNSLKKNNGILEQNKQKFYDLLCSQRESFDRFYKNQIPYFVADANSLLYDLNDEEKAEIYSSLPSGQFTKGKNEYYNFLSNEIDKFTRGQLKKKMLNKWFEKTGTNNPMDWSDRFLTPIICMVPEQERTNARKMFDIIKSSNPSEDDAKAAIEFMDNATFYDKLNSQDERDKLFMELIVGTNAVLLTDVNKIRNELRAKVSQESPYYWYGSSAVQKCLSILVDREYKLKGSEKANQIIDNMDASQLREYLKRRIADDPAFGIQILKGEK